LEISVVDDEEPSPPPHIDVQIGRPHGSEQPLRRKFIGVLFDCCNIYRRIYLNDEETAYEGKCPACSRSVRMIIDPSSSNSQRFYRIK